MGRGFRVHTEVVLKPLIQRRAACFPLEVAEGESHSRMKRGIRTACTVSTEALRGQWLKGSRERAKDRLVSSKTKTIAV